MVSCALNFYVVQAGLILSPLNVDSKPFLFCKTDFFLFKEETPISFLLGKEAVFSLHMLLSHIIHEVTKLYLKRKL